MIHQEHFELSGGVGDGKRVDATFVLCGSNGARKGGINLTILIGGDQIAIVWIKRRHDLLHLGLKLPPVGVGFEPHILGGHKFIDHIGTCAKRIVRVHLRGVQNGKGHGIEQTVIASGCRHNDGVVIGGGDIGDKVFDVLIKSVVCHVFSVGKIQNIVASCHHIIGGEGRAIGEVDIITKGERPGRAAVRIDPTLGEQRLWQAVIIDGDEAFIDDVIKGDDVSFHRNQRTNGERFGAHNAEK